MVSGKYWGRCESIKYTKGYGVLDSIKNMLEFSLKDASQGLINDLWLPAPFPGEIPEVCSCVKSIDHTADVICSSCYGIGLLGGYRKYGYNYIELGSTMDLLTYNDLELELDREIRPFRLVLEDDVDLASAVSDPFTMLFSAPVEYKVDAYSHGGDNNKVVVEYSKDAGTTWLPIADITMETGGTSLTQVIFKVTLSRDPGERSPEFEFLRVRTPNQFIKEPFIYISRTRNPQDIEKEKQGIKLKEPGIRFWTILDFELPSRCFVKNTTVGNPFYGQLTELFDFQRSYFDNFRYRQIFNARAISKDREIFWKVF